MPYVSPFRPEHPVFPQPDDGATKVWRYLDLARLITVLSNRQLPFIRADRLNDEFEGSIPQALFEWHQEDLPNAAWWKQMRLETKRELYVSCWHENNAESEAMWRLYCGSRDGVAMQTVYERLDSSLPNEVRLGRVTYVEYGMPEQPWDFNTRLPWTNALMPIMHKRPAFSHEHEVRAVIWRPPPDDNVVVRNVEWNAEESLDRVFVSPYAQPWYRDAVVAVLERFAPTLVGKLCWSRMRGTPQF